MSKQAIAAHVAIAVLTLLAGYVGYATYGFGCSMPGSRMGRRATMLKLGSISCSFRFRP